jgi:hypothetical protein
MRTNFSDGELVSVKNWVSERGERERERERDVIKYDLSWMQKNEIDSKW